MEKARTAWLNSLKPGDEVAVKYCRYGEKTYMLNKVKRVTKTLVVVPLMVGEQKFRKSNGLSMKSSTYLWESLVPANGEVKDKVNKQAMQSEAMGLLFHVRKNIKGISTFHLKQVIKALGDSLEALKGEQG